MRRAIGLSVPLAIAFDCHFTYGGTKYTAHMYIAKVVGHAVYYHVRVAVS
jgi:hypothetical protein